MGRAPRGGREGGRGLPTIARDLKTSLTRMRVALERAAASVRDPAALEPLTGSFWSSFREH